MARKTDSYKQSIWLWLIRYGGACIDSHGGSYSWTDYTNYYSAKLNIDKQLSQEVYEKLAVGIDIDFDASSDPAEHVGKGFNGTFTSTQLEFRYLLGTLVFEDGSEYAWGCHIDDDVGFGGAVAIITTPIDRLHAMDGLGKRLRGGSLPAYHSDYEFTYGCKLPIKHEQRFSIEDNL